jgi:hypothetical protein
MQIAAHRSARRIYGKEEGAKLKIGNLKAETHSAKS